MPRHLFGFSLLAGLAASPLTAVAQQAPPHSVDPLVVTSSRSGDATPAGLVGASVSVIDDQALQHRQTVVVSDVLRDVPGVAVSREGAVGALTQVRIRGAEGNQTLVLIDGIKASDPFFDEYDFGTLIADEAARIEVLRGQQSSLYGSDAIGGVISYVTLTGAEAPGVRLRAEGGGLGTYAGGGRVAGVSGDLDYALSASGLRTGGYPVAPGGHRDVGSDSVGASAKLIWTPAANLHFTAVGRYSHTRADLDDTNPDSASPTFGLTVDSPGVHSINDAVYGLARAQIDLLDGRWTQAVTAQVADTRRTGFDVADAFAPAAGQPIVKASGDHGRRFRESYESTSRFGDGPVKQRVTVAVDGEQNTSRTTVSSFGAFLGAEHIDTAGVVGEYDLTLDEGASFGASVRHDWNNRFADATTYRAQGSYRFGEGARLHAAAGSGVKNPSFSELFDFVAGRFLGNPNLQPERSQGWEIGLDRTILSGHANLGATWFDNRLDHQITTDFSTGVARPVNLPGSERQRGVELFADGQLSAAWRLDASYTRLDAPQTRSVIRDGAFVTFDGQAVRRARDIASANLTWAPPGQPFATTLTVRYNGRQNDLAFTDPSFTPVLVSLRGFTLVNLAATWRLTPQAELFGRVENLLAQSYQEVFSFAAPGRAAYGGVRLRF
jgi:vitamin B12 transporter